MTECGRCEKPISQRMDTWVHNDTGMIRCHEYDAMMGSARPSGEYSREGLHVIRESWRALMAATR